VQDSHDSHRAFLGTAFKVDYFARNVPAKPLDARSAVPRLLRIASVPPNKLFQLTRRNRPQSPPVRLRLLYRTLWNVTGFTLQSPCRMEARVLTINEQFAPDLLRLTPTYIVSFGINDDGITCVVGIVSFGINDDGIICVVGKVSNSSTIPGISCGVGRVQHPNHAPLE